MTAVNITDQRGGPHNVPRSALDALAAQINGSLIYPTDEAFAESTTIWNALARREPAVVIRPSNTEAVARTVDFARDNGLLLSIKGGGHNIAGLALAEGAMTIDMSAMRQVEVDVASRLARVGGGCTLGDVDRQTQPHGLAAPLGFVSMTGVAGLTLGGGFGYLSRRFGWTVDTLEEVELVTADGQVLRASRSVNADLFWALRGGGGNFGVVTEFTFRLHEVGPQIMGGVIAWHGSEADGVLDVFRKAAESAPRELTLVVVRRNAPPAPWLPESVHGKPVIMVLACHSGDLAAAERDLAPIKSHSQPVADMIQVKDYTAQQTMLDATQPTGMHYYWKSEFVPGLSDGLLAAYNEPFVGLEAPANQMVLFQVSGALNEHPEDDGAVGNRDAGFACVIQSMWRPDSPDGGANRDWVRRAWQQIKPYSTGGNYINFQTSDEPDERMSESYRANLARLAQVKGQYDPANLFRVNRNIAPDRSA